MNGSNDNFKKYYWKARRLNCVVFPLSVTEVLILASVTAVHILGFLKITKKRFKDEGQLVMEVKTTCTTASEILKQCRLELVSMLHEEARL